MKRVLDVRQDLGKTVVVLRPYTIWESIAFPLGMVVWMLVYAALTKKPYTPSERAVFGLIVLAGGLVVGSIAYFVAFLLVGREEIVTASEAALVIDRQVLRWPEMRSRRSYEVRRLRNLRAVAPAAPMRAGKPVTPAPPRLDRIFFAFDYDGQTVRFATGLRGAEAERAMQALTQAIAAPREVG